MQTRHEAIALCLINDERDVQIVRSLGDEIDFLLFEQLERFAEAMQNRADVAADETHRCTRTDNLHATELREIGRQRFERALSSVLAAGSSDTVTLVSEVDTKSIDRP